eukprot:14898243-Alexandrium_andersonii.AAC.1
MSRCPQRAAALGGAASAPGSSSGRVGQPPLQRGLRTSLRGGCRLSGGEQHPVPVHRQPDKSRGSTAHSRF